MNPAEPDSVLIFRSLLHPGKRSFSYIFSVSVVRPLAFCMIPVMLGTLVSMLQGLPVLFFLYAGFPLAIGISSLWTVHRMQITIVEVRFRDDAVAMRSQYDVGRRLSTIEWYRILDMESDNGRLHVTIGRDIRKITRSEWSTYEDLKSQLSSRFALVRAPRHYSA